jgi:hypothetical protein
MVNGYYSETDCRAVMSLNTSCACPSCLQKRNEDFMSGKKTKAVSYGICIDGVPRTHEDLNLWVDFSSNCGNCLLRKHESGQRLLTADTEARLRAALNRGITPNKKRVDAAAEFFESKGIIL